MHHGTAQRVRAGLLAAVLGCCVGHAAAQWDDLPPGSIYSPQYLQGSAWDRLEPIDPGTADVGHLGLQTRLVPMDLRADQGYGMLYRAMGADGNTVFARRDGGITAVFSRSAYASTAVGDVAMIPPDTTYIIGEPSLAVSHRLGLDAQQTGRADPSGGLRIDSRIETAVDPLAPVRRSFLNQDEDPTPRVGIRALLRRAGDAERSGGR